MKHLLSIGLFGPDKEEAREQIFKLVIDSLRMYPYYAQGEKMPVPRGENDQRGLAIWASDERSTRTRVSSEEAARAVSFEVANPLTGESSSRGKGESWMNTLRMLIQYGATSVIVRSEVEGLGLHLAQCLETTASPETWVRRDVSIIIGGAGRRDHPSQVLLDIVTIVLRELGVRCDNDYAIVEDILHRQDAEQRLRERIAGILDNLKIAFVGDLLHSRVVHDWLHMGKWFSINFMLIAPQGLQVQPWSYRDQNVALSSSLGDALDKPYLYTIRLQKERLEETMPTTDAERILKEFQITPGFLEGFEGEILDAQPQDQRSPMIIPELWVHPKVIMFMQSAVGIPTRMAILRLCYAGRREQIPLLVLPDFRLHKGCIIKNSSLEEHWRIMQQKQTDEKLFAKRVKNGTVVDRLLPGTVDLIHAINRRARVYAKGKGQILRGEEFDSESMGGKEVIFLHDRWPPYLIMATYGLVAPTARMSVMKEGRGKNGYRRIALPLPEAVEGIFTCPNPHCVTNCEAEAETFFRVHGEKGDASLECAFCETHFPATPEYLHVVV